MAPEGVDALATMAIPPLALKAPWHVRHARTILYGVASLASAGVAYFAYYAWSLHTDPLDRSIAARWRADRAPALAGDAPIAATPHQAITGEVVVPAAGAAAPAVPRKPQPRASLGKQIDAARVEAATRVPPLARGHAAVTHTRPNDAASEIAEVAAAPSSGNDKPRRSAGSPCSAEVTALGLCNPGAEQERR